MSISNDDLGRITQQTHVVSSDGDRLGSVNQVYTSDTTGDPAWVTVKTGLFGTQESFVPLSDASFDGDDIRVGVTKQAVHDAPRVDSDGHLTPEEEDGLYRHYGLHDQDGAGGDDLGDGRDEGEAREHGAAAGTAAAAGTGVGAATSRGQDADDRDGRLGDDPRPGDQDDRLGDDLDADGSAGRDAAAAGAGTGVGAAGGAALGGGFGRDRTDDQTEPRHAAPDPNDRSVAAENGPEHAEDDDQRSGQQGAGGQEAVRPGERTTRLRRYVVTERVVQTVEELPDEDSPSR